MRRLKSTAEWTASAASAATAPVAIPRTVRSLPLGDPPPGRGEEQHEAGEGESQPGNAGLGEGLDVVVLGVLDAHDPVAALEARVRVVEGPEAVAEDRARRGEAERVAPGVDPERRAAEAAQPPVRLDRHERDEDEDERPRERERGHEARASRAPLARHERDEAGAPRGEGDRAPAGERGEPREGHGEGGDQGKDDAARPRPRRPVAAAGASRRRRARGRGRPRAARPSRPSPRSGSC